MTHEEYEMSAQILLEIESMQNHLNFAISLAQQVKDDRLISELQRSKLELSTARETLMNKMRSASA